MTTPPPRSANELAEDRTTLADERTSMALTRTMVALDRTLMAWIRTATSLISFGFTTYKVFQALRAGQPASQVHYLIEPRGMAMLLIGLGVGGLALAMLEYRRQVVALQTRYARYGPFHQSMTAGVATVLSGIGILGFILVVLRQ
jgi:putative membrane protein